MPKFQPRNPHWATSVRTNFNNNPTMKLLGAALCQVAPGDINLIAENIDQQNLIDANGCADTGIVAAMMQTACHLAALSLSPQHSHPQPAEFKVNYIGNWQDCPAGINISGKVVRPGNTIMVCRADAIAHNLGGMPLNLAAMTATFLMEHPDS